VSTFCSLIRLGLGLVAGSILFAQTQFHYTGNSVTGQLKLTGTVNLTALALGPQHAQAVGTVNNSRPEGILKVAPKLLPPPPPLSPLAALATRAAAMLSLPVNPSNSFGFSGLTHLDQRNANGGNQYSVEPPNPSIAVGNDFILEGVNNAIQVYSKAGTPQLLLVLATNQVFLLPPAINRGTNIAGVFPTDMRVFYDQGISRWFILQRAQCCDTVGNNVHNSQIYIAVSQTADPRAAYNVYMIDTTDAQAPGCPFGCVADYPQIGADAYGFYVTWNEYPLTSNADPSGVPLGASILAISKTSLSSGATLPTAYRFVLPTITAFEFSIQPANIPQGANYFTASGGMELFVSNISTGGSSLSVWAMTNTSYLDTGSASPSLTRISIPALHYSEPGNAVQRPGAIPYGSSLHPAGVEALLDGADCRVLSVAWAYGRLYVTFGTLVVDENLRVLAGGAYVVVSPTFRGGLLAANVLNTGYLVVKNNHLLRPAVAVNAQAPPRGAIGFTIVGPDYFPSAAFVTIDGFSTGTAVQLAGPGALPEDGFTGYPGNGSQGVARWGDYSTAAVSADGSIWIVTEYIPNAPRTQFANWGTYVIQYTP
jgi:hypothetical protein